MGIEGINNGMEEYYFDNFYRVVLLRDDEKYVVSVDVYYAGWKYDDQRKICVENTCLIIKEIDPSETSISLQDVERIFVIGVKVDNKFETINVKWILKSKPCREVIETIYKFSWKLASGMLI
ncbi:MAG: hypothetical protein QXK41_05245 [Desulfurococcaceae archaeon]